MDVFRQRLEDEYDANVIITAPTVPYRGMFLSFSLINAHGADNVLIIVVVRPSGTQIISNPTEFPDPSDNDIKNIVIEEPIVNATIIVPQSEYR
jgi:translation factor GUF1, mitochondrial